MFTIAVTGTNGKTSCTQWLGYALSGLGEPTAVIGTLGIGLFKRGAHDEIPEHRLHHAGCGALAAQTGEDA